MVRLKQRYILFDILYPPSTSQDSNEVVEFSKSETNALLSLHQSSPASFNQKTLTQLFRRTIQENYGDYGAGSAGMQMSVKYFSNKTSTGIVRCGRQNFNMVIGSLATISRIDNREVIIRCIHVSGTIKKCEEYCIKRNKELMKIVKGSKSKDRILEQFATDSQMMNLSDDNQES